MYSFKKNTLKAMLFKVMSLKNKCLKQAMMLLRQQNFYIDLLNIIFKNKYRDLNLYFGITESNYFKTRCNWINTLRDHRTLF